MAEFRAELDINPFDVPSHVEIGDLELKAGKAAEAVEAVRPGRWCCSRGMRARNSDWLERGPRRSSTSKRWRHWRQRTLWLRAMKRCSTRRCWLFGVWVERTRRARRKPSSRAEDRRRKRSVKSIRERLKVGPAGAVPRRDADRRSACCCHLWTWRGRRGSRRQLIFGGVKEKKSFSRPGSGVALIDYDNDGWTDVFFVNRGTLADTGAKPTNHLYRNLKNGKFEDVTAKAGLGPFRLGPGRMRSRLRQRRIIDLFVTYWGQNVLYGIGDDGTIAGRHRSGRLLLDPRPGGEAGARSSTTTMTAALIYSCPIMSISIWLPRARRAPSAFCQYLGLAVMCGPRGTDRRVEPALSQQWRRYVLRIVRQISGVGKARGNFGLGVLTADFDNDGWPDVYVANDTNRQSAVSQQTRRQPLKKSDVFAGVAYNADGQGNFRYGCRCGRLQCRRLAGYLQNELLR